MPPSAYMPRLRLVAALAGRTCSVSCQSTAACLSPLTSAERLISTGCPQPTLSAPAPAALGSGAAPMPRSCASPSSWMTNSFATIHGSIRLFSSESKEGAMDTKEGGAPGDQTAAGAGEASGESGSQEAKTSLSVEEMAVAIEEKDAAILELREKVETLTDSFKRSLAETENVRMRATRDVDAAKKFAVQGFVKSLLDVVDNLERAAAAVPEEALAVHESGSSEDAEKLRNLLDGLMGGVKATERIMLHTLKMNGVERYDPIGEKFDPNLHAALFEIPDGSKEAGTVAVVSKRGYKLHDRVIRPAEVGVVRAP